MRRQDGSGYKHVQKEESVWRKITFIKHLLYARSYNGNLICTILFNLYYNPMSQWSRKYGSWMEKED
jgi:hypothetical protein